MISFGPIPSRRLGKTLGIPVAVITNASAVQLLLDKPLIEVLEYQSKKYYVKKYKLKKRMSKFKEYIYLYTENNSNKSMKSAGLPDSAARKGVRCRVYGI